MSETSKRWADIGRAVTGRMKERAMSQADLTRESGVSEFTVRKLMKGEGGNYRHDRLAKVATALGWTADSLDRILVGHDPVERDNGATTIEDSKINEMFERIDGHEERLGAIESEVAEIRALVAEIKAAVGDGAPPARRRGRT